ncbi:hypothetical protein [Hoeflea sp.]|uniref:hypothetical protein n=1 Tax=Hoeflea sp. TaxID=1940281 RepID=UPI003A939371
MAAALSRTSPISCEFELIAELISRNTSDEGLSLSPDKARTLMKRLNEIRNKIATLEHELGAHRVHEQGRAAAGVLDDLCMEVLQGGVLDAAQGAPVVYPDFRKGK